MQITDPIADLLTRIRNASRGRSCFQPEEGNLPDSG